MRETWLRANRRVLLLGMILPVVLTLIGLIMALSNETAAWSPWRGFGLAIAAIGLLLLGLIGLQMKIPRLGYAEGDVLVYLRAGAPLRVPVENVECLFLAKGAGQLPGPGGGEVPVRNLVIRISEKATNLHHRQVKPALGRWDEGYITIHGAWCEPLTLEIVRQLNDRLAEVQCAKQAASQSSL